ncbi:hypothetical protein [Streptomyces sp. NBC_01361]|uniref:hypothetical protein n=1 Tax=Streptomyces sp. NBC_01361 TaxID=2903838 RepID=UPI002E33BA8B|nr:hypothetical protein [Streptomyces sp. NBC_01361]
MTTPTSHAAVVQAGDVIGCEGQWRKAQAIKTVVLQAAARFPTCPHRSSRDPAGLRSARDLAPASQALRAYESCPVMSPGDKWVNHDLNDLYFLACAAGYADYVVAEKKTGHLLRNANRTLTEPRASVHLNLRSLVHAL